MPKVEIKERLSHLSFDNYIRGNPNLPAPLSRHCKQLYSRLLENRRLLIRHKRRPR